MKRICLFAGYSSNNTIEDYVIYYLKALSENSDVYYYCDSDLPDSELRKISPYVKASYAKRHKKYDFGSWQELVRAIGRDKIRKYDELILANDSCYGPLFTLSDLFKKMEGKKVDFWGLSSSVGYHVHIQSYFIVFNKSVINTDYLFEFLETVKQEKSLREVCDNYEDMLTYILSQKGFTYTSYIPLDDRNLHPYFKTWDCIKERKFPLLKVKTFYGVAGQQPIKDYKSFLKEYTDYDPTLIEKDLNNRGLSNKQIANNLKLKRKTNKWHSIKAFIAKPVIVFWNKYISKFDKRFDRNNLNISNSYIGLSRQLSYVEQKLENLYELNNITDSTGEIEKFIKKYANVSNKYNLVSNFKPTNIKFVDNSLIFNNIQDLFRAITEHVHFCKRRYYKILFYGQYNINDLMRFYMNNNDIFIINQDNDKSVEYTILKDRIANTKNNFTISDEYENREVFNVIFVNAVDKSGKYEDIIEFYKCIINLMDFESVLITCVNGATTERLEDFLVDLNLDVDLYTQELFRYDISCCANTQMIYLKKSMGNKKNQ